mmetsp:Transcript_5515/g.21165  ORF Transcript_5515/g.21165 Transcript_5515/m.21165 type:complete len:223 (-) Transcript_5515:296-964(-)
MSSASSFRSLLSLGKGTSPRRSSSCCTSSSSAAALCFQVSMRWPNCACSWAHLFTQFARLRSSGTQSINVSHCPCRSAGWSDVFFSLSMACGKSSRSLALRSRAAWMRAVSSSMRLSFCCLWVLREYLATCRPPICTSMPSRQRLQASWRSRIALRWLAARRRWWRNFRWNESTAPRRGFSDHARTSAAEGDSCSTAAVRTTGSFMHGGTGLPGSRDFALYM